MDTITQFGIIPIDFGTLKTAYSTLKSHRDKVSDLEKRGSLIRLKKGLYVVSPSVTGKELSVELIANHIYGPSYVSMESALRFYGLIPETVYNTFSMTLKRSRTFSNSLGQFIYTSCPPDYYHIGITSIISQDHAFLIASPEKSLCDLIAHTPKLNIRSVKSLYTYLEDDLRFDMERFHMMNPIVFEKCAEVTKKKIEIINIIKLLNK